MRKVRITAAVLPLLALVLSCTEKTALPERISVSTADGTPLSNTLYIPLEGETSHLRVKAGRKLDISYESAPDTAEEWFSYSVKEEGSGEYVINYSAKPRGNTLEKRSGSLKMAAAEEYLGAFLNVRQGYEQIWKENFSGKELTILPGNSWTSKEIKGISSIKDGWLSFSAKADEDGTSLDFPLLVSISGGGYFEEINRSSYLLDIQAADSYSSDSIYKLRIYNGGTVFSSESAVTFTVPSEKASIIHIGEVSVYEIPVKSSGITGISDSDE